MPSNKKPGDAGGRTPGIPDCCDDDLTNSTSTAQRARLLNAFQQRGAITTLQARRELDVLLPAARVMELRRSGHVIETVWTHDVTSAGHTHRVARYRLLDQDGGATGSGLPNCIKVHAKRIGESRIIARTRIETGGGMTECRNITFEGVRKRRERGNLRFDRQPAHQLRRTRRRMLCN